MRLPEDVVLAVVLAYEFGMQMSAAVANSAEQSREIFTGASSSKPSIAGRLDGCRGFLSPVFEQTAASGQRGRIRIHTAAIILDQPLVFIFRAMGLR